MSISRAALMLLALAVSVASPAIGATITGSVKGPDGNPFMGAFVIAENSQNRITVNVLSDQQGRYRIPNLPAATYAVRIRAIGYASDPRTDVPLTSDESRSFDFALKPATVRWSDLTTYQGRQLLPKTATIDLAKGGQYPSDPFFVSCLQSCHSFQTRMASTVRNEAGWRDRAAYMRDVIMAGEGPPMAESRFNDIVSYLTTAFGTNSPKTPSPADMPEYKSLVRPVSPRSMNIVYVEYDTTGTSAGLPWSAVEDKDGMVWMPYYGRGNGVGRLNPKTGEIATFTLPSEKTAGVHSVVPSHDGTAWFTEYPLGRIAQLNPATQDIAEFQDRTPAGMAAGKHTVRVAPDGGVWTSGGPHIARFDPATKTFAHFPVPDTYGIEFGRNGDVWLCVFKVPGDIIRVAKDGTVTRFTPPTTGKPQRIALDQDGLVWFTERQGGRIGRLDPVSGAIKEFPLPGPASSPYAIGFDRQGMVWYSSTEQDTLGRLDPKTGEVSEYPFPHSEGNLRELFPDSQGRLWYATPSNNKVGYFYLAE